MTENKPIEFLESLKQFGWRLGLENITNLLAWLGNPHEKFQSVHIAGTNGKGSVAAILDSIWRCAGYKTGLYTSPHLIDVTERIKVAGECISQARFVEYIRLLKPKVRSLDCTYFETVTAVAFKYFADVGVDLAFLEVGLGGSYDATNVVRPLLSVITTVDLDHTEHLGQTRSEIAREKAGIIKREIPSLSGSEDRQVNRVLKRVANERASPFYSLDATCSMRIDLMTENASDFNLAFPDQRYDGARLSLAGLHQVRNAALAVQASRLIKGPQWTFRQEDVFRGLRQVYYPARLESVEELPRVLVDVAHNPAAMEALLESIRSIFTYERLLVVVGLLRDKDYPRLAKLLSRSIDHLYAVTPNSERSLGGEVLAAEMARYTDAYTICGPVMVGFEQAYESSSDGDVICVTGSHFTVGEFLNFYKKT
ncbi:bifunctional folylpolyglutamate synthase/dihydrofolate synthase [bacterium]|nr:bifunctional folylpolyglutamate synthase/dihydrofolate synthase [bacterium]